MPEQKRPSPDLRGEAFKPLPRWARPPMTVGPLAALALILLGIAALYGRASVVFVLSMFLGGFLGGGKLVILAGGIDGAPVGTWLLAAMVVYGDAGTSLMIMANMDYIYRIPVLGRRLAEAREVGYQVLRNYKWMRRAAELGMTVFVALPFQGSGAVLGVVLGRILGLTRPAIFSFVVLGSGAGSALVALAGEIGHDEITLLAADPTLGVCAALFALVITYLLGRWFLGLKRREHPAWSDPVAAEREDE